MIGMSTMMVDCFLVNVAVGAGVGCEGGGTNKSHESKQFANWPKVSI